jgi:hypothetical protein
MQEQRDLFATHRDRKPWNKGKMNGAKPPLRHCPHVRRSGEYEQQGRLSPRGSSTDVCQKRSPWKRACGIVCDCYRNSAHLVIILYLSPPADLLA